jgi:hypothetical protein
MIIVFGFVTFINCENDNEKDYHLALVDPIHTVYNA